MLPTCILLWTLPLFKRILAHFSKPKFILIFIIIGIIIILLLLLLQTHSEACAPLSALSLNSALFLYYDLSRVENEDL